MLKKESIKVICSNCGKVFFTYPYRHGIVRFCSVKCKTDASKGLSAWNKGKQNKVKIVCKTCKKIFERYPSRKAIFCSAKCQSIDRIGIKRPDVSDRMKGNKYALGRVRPISERLKIGIANKGEKNNFWRGGKMRDYPEKEIIRKSSQYQQWRNDVFIRDNWTCQKTKIKGGKLISHHINNFEDNPTERLNTYNGITLSEKAHKEFHKKYGVKNNTRKQLEEFLQ